MGQAAMAFVFLNPGPMRDGELELRLWQTVPGDPKLGWAPAYHFRMVDLRTGANAGLIDLRVADLARLKLYAGHIGYQVDPPSRGRHFAARSVRLLLPLAVQHGMRELWITCNPDNLASRRTCELAGGQFVEIVEVPPEDPLFHEGEVQKCRYRFWLGG